MGEGSRVRARAFNFLLSTFSFLFFLNNGLRTPHSAFRTNPCGQQFPGRPSILGPRPSDAASPSSIIHHPSSSPLVTPHSGFRIQESCSQWSLLRYSQLSTLNSQLSKGPSHLPPRRYPRPGRGRTTALLYCFRPQILRRRGPGAYSDEWGGMGVPIAGHWSTRTVCGGLSVASETVARGSQGGEALSADSCSKPALLHEQLCFTGGKTVPTPCNWRCQRRRLF